ncbi:hypothetical protein C0992_000360 [Termitomyces sp. T32_za158]|nr:hypothetical protein C0992_000360 [Termitomyces sp. T32_za158]
MPPPRWTTEEQTKFLFSHIGKFTEHQNNDTLHSFWPYIEREWDARWPVNPTSNEKEGSELGLDRGDEKKICDDAQLKKVLIFIETDTYIQIMLIVFGKRLRAWYNNNSETRKKPPAKTTIASVPGVGTRVKQPSEIWASKFYKLKVQEKVKAECEANNIPSNKALSVIKRHIKEGFEAEPEEVRQQILAESQALKEAAKARRINPMSPTPESYAEAISYISDVSYGFLDAQHEKTGWTWTLLGGGPDPSHGGRLRTVVFHAGQNHLGHNFGAAHATFREAVLNPFAAFVKSAFSPDICAARSLIDIESEHLKSLDEEAINTLDTGLPKPPAPSLSPLSPALPAPSNTSSQSDTPAEHSTPLPPETPSSQSDMPAEHSTPLPPETPKSPVVSSLPLAEAQRIVIEVPDSMIDPVLRSPLDAENNHESLSSAAEVLTTFLDGTSFVFPNNVYRDEYTSPPSWNTSSPETSVLPPNELLPGLVKNLAAPSASVAVNQPKSKPKPRPKKVNQKKATTPAPEAETGRGQRVRKARNGKEVMPLTVDADGKPTFDANRNPVRNTSKRKRGKENTTTAKKAKK